MEYLSEKSIVELADDSGEENYQSADDDELESAATSVFTSLKDTVASAVDMVSEVSLGLEGDQIKTDSKVITEGDREDEEGGQVVIIASGSSTSSINTGKDEGASGLGTSEDWSVVDSILDSQGGFSQYLEEDERLRLTESDRASSAPIKGVQSNSLRSLVTGSLPSEIVALPDDEGLLPEELTFNAAGSEDIGRQGKNVNVIAHLGSSPRSSTNFESTSFPGKPHSLRKRHRQLKAGDFVSSASDGPGPVRHRFNETDSSRSRKDSSKHVEELRKSRSDVELGDCDEHDRKGSISDRCSVDKRKTRSLEYTEPDIESLAAGTGNQDETDGGIRLRERKLRKEDKSLGRLGVTDAERVELTGPPRRQVYVQPQGDADLDPGARSTFPWPGELVIRFVGFQIKVMIQVIAISLFLFKFVASFISEPIERASKFRRIVEDMATGVVNQGFGVVAQMKEQTRPRVTDISKKVVLGCLGSAWFICVLIVLLLSAFCVNFLVVRRMVEYPVQLRETLYFDYTQARPNATVPLLTRQDWDRAKTLSVSKLANVRKIPAGHQFHVTLTLTLPESEHNLKLGMFQVSAEVLSARNEVLVRQSRPCILPFRSTPVRLFKGILHSVPLLMGFLNEARKLKLVVLKAQELSIPTAVVRISLEPRAGVLQGAGLPEIYDAEFHLQSALPWSKAILRRCKMLLILGNGAFLFLFEVATVLCCCRQALLPSWGGGTADTESIVIGDVKESKGAVPTSSDSSLTDLQLKNGIYDGAEVSHSFRKSLLLESSRLSSSDDLDVMAEVLMPPLEEVSSADERRKVDNKKLKSSRFNLSGYQSEDFSDASTNLSLAE